MKIAYTIMVLAAAFAARAESKFGAISPDGLNEVRLETGAKGMSYSVWRRGKALVEPTAISLVTSEHGRMNGENADPNTTTRKVEGKIATPIYKKSEVDLEANETRVDFGDWAVVLHARNDGVAWRFETKYDGEATVTAENTNVRFPKGAMLCYGQVGGFATSFERPATIGPVESVKSGHPQIVITPLTASVPGAGVVCITESNLLDYPGLNFYRRDGETDMLRSWQAGVPSETERKGRWIRVKNRHSYLAKTSGTRVYPWRVFVLGDTPSDLVLSDAVYALAEPCRLADTSWVKPGLVQWDWWHGFKITDVPGLKSGCNYETYRAYIDYASASGIPYIIMDEGWSERLNLDKPRDAVNVEGVINYGKEKGVGVILWAAWAMLYDPADRARVFDRYAAMGAKGFKIDFMDRDDQDIERFLENTASDAAKRKLVVMYHGVHKPTGLCRTFPNVLNYEGVYGLEQGHSRGGQKVVVANDVNLPYTRMVAGAMDYTPGAMRNRAFSAPEFQKGKDVPSCYGTRCHQLALFPIFEAPVQMLCDSPTQYRSEPECAAFIAQVPTVWDETVGVAGEIGAFASVARRKDRDWWLGAITNWEKRELELPTKFLGEGEWKVEAFADADDADVNAEHYVRREFTVKAGDSIKVCLAPGGGFAARFTPASKSDAEPYFVEAPGSAKLVFDTSNAPDLRKWTEDKFAPTICKWVVKLTDIMASDGWEPPKKILFQFVVQPLESDKNAPAWASSGKKKVSLRVDWFRKNLDGEALGATIHELVHIMQNYWTKGHNKDNCPGWASEGYADYIRWFLFEPESDGCGYVRKNIKKYHYNDSYRVTAHFFGFVEGRYPGTMKKLNAAMRDHTFDNGKFWKDATGKTVEDLEADWKSDAVGAATTPKVEDFKVKLTGVAAMPADDGDDGKAKVLPPQTRIVVTPGNLAVFFLEYSFPPNVKSRMYLGPNFDEGVLGEDPFGTSASGLITGNGKITKVVLLGAGGDEPYEKDLLLKSVRIRGELEAEEGAPRNNSFFICDMPVNVLFANKADRGLKGQSLSIQ